MDERSTPPEKVDLGAGIAGAGGVVWSTSPGGFHANLVVLGPHDAIAEHRNDALAVLVVVVGGRGVVHVDGRRVPVHAGEAVLVGRGSVRSIVASDDGLRYLTVHGERAPMAIGRRVDREASS